MTDVTSLMDVVDHLKAVDPELPLEISLDGTALRGGYHVTELRLAQVQAVDCGGRGSAWTEAQVQVMDGGGGKRMAAGKFVEIAGRSMGALEGLGSALLVVEGAPGNGGLGRYRLDRVAVEAEAARLELVPLTAVCRPLADHMAAGKASACCAA